MSCAQCEIYEANVITSTGDLCSACASQMIADQAGRIAGVTNQLLAEQRKNARLVAQLAKVAPNG